MLSFFPVRTLTLFMLAVVAVLPARAQQGAVVDEIAAVVGEQILLRSEVDAVVAGVMRQQEIPYSEGLWFDALSQLTDEKVLVIHAKRDTTIIVSEEQVTQSLTDRINQMASQVGGQARLEQVYGKSVVEIRAELREDFREQLLAEQLRNRKLRSIRVTPSEVREWFERFPTDSLPTLPEMVRVSHIVRFPAVTEAARRDARDVITAIRDSVSVGSFSFEDMATTFSEDPGSASSGGRYESMSIREVVPEFAAVASRLPIGEISRVFETQFGLHILRVNSRKGDMMDYNHILIKFDESKSDTQVPIDLLTTLRDSILTGGATLADLARRHSEDPSSSIRGGRVVDPRTGERELYVEALGSDWQRTLVSLDVGDLSEPSSVQLLDGRRAYHIVRLRERRASHRVDISTDYSMIEQYATQEKQQEVFGSWMKRLRSDVFIDQRVQPTGLSSTIN